MAHAHGDAVALPRFIGFIFQIFFTRRSSSNFFALSLFFDHIFQFLHDGSTRGLLVGVHHGVHDVFYCSCFAIFELLRSRFDALKSLSDCFNVLSKSRTRLSRASCSLLSECFRIFCGHPL